MKFLVPIDGSESSRRAVEHVIRLARRGDPPEIHLLNVRGQVDAWEVRRFLSDAEIAKMQIHEGEEEIRALGDPDFPGIEKLPIRPRVATAPRIERP